MPPKKLKICLIGPTYPFRGGISHYTTLLYRHLRQKHEVHFFAFKRQYPDWLYPGATDKDSSQAPLKEEAVYHLLDSVNPLTWLMVAFKIIKAAPDLLVLPWWVAFWAPQFWTITTLIKRFTKTRVLFICHNVVEHESNRFNAFCTKYVLNKGDHFIVHSEEDLNNLKGFLPMADLKKCFHPTYGVFNTAPIPREEAQKSISISGKAILFFGFVRPYKGLKYLLNAMPIISRELDVTLLIVGEFWNDENTYMEQIEALGIQDRVKIFNRYVPNEEVPLYFNATDLVVLPYVSATGSGIVQLAFGFEKPVVTTDVGCLPEVVSHLKDGYIVPARNAEAIAQCVIHFYRSAKSDAFKAHISDKQALFSWEHITTTIETFS